MLLAPSAGGQQEFVKDRDETTGHRTTSIQANLQTFIRSMQMGYPHLLPMLPIVGVFKQEIPTPALDPIAQAAYCPFDILSGPIGKT